MIDINDLIEHGSIFKTTYPGGYTFGWRLLTMKEYRIFRGLRELGVLPEFSLYRKVFDRIYIGDCRTINRHIPLGMLVAIGQLCMTLSGDDAGKTIKQDIEAARQLAQPGSIDSYMKNVIFMAFASYTIEDVEGWNRRTFLNNFARAEALLIPKMDHTPIDLDKELVTDVPEQATETPKVNQTFDFENDHKQMEKSMGWEYYEQQRLEADRDRGKVMQRMAKYEGTGLTIEQARELDRLSIERGR